ncbi:hypothetical protein [Amycolatopsis sp. NPDC004169]|uniref:hypothetical protein n=1 Tax=Amycolatopsis sp. NPDC004169 TaxID=3154453 RepID=UPI0033AAE1BE
MHNAELWRYEAKRAGRHVLAAPPLLAVLLLGTGLGLRGAGFTGTWVAQAVPPLVTGLAAAAIAGGERAAELHLSLPTPLRTTFARRLALLGAATALAALALAAALLPDLAALTRFGTVCAFAALLTAIGTWSAARMRSVAGASTVVLTAWFGELFVFERVFAAPAVRIFALLVLAVLVAVPAARLLADGRGLLEGGRE